MEINILPLNYFVCKPYMVWFMVFNATFNNISVISWRLFLLVEETGGPGENHQPAASHWHTLSHNVVHLALSESRTHKPYMELTIFQNRQIDKNIETTFCSWPLTFIILKLQDLESASMIGRLQIRLQTNFLLRCLVRC